MFCIRDHFFTTVGAATEIGVERHTIDRWIKSGKLEAQKVGTVVFIEKSAIKELKREREAARN